MNVLLPQGSSRTPQDRPPRLLYVVSEDWYFLSHRLPMARAARAAGFDVHVATRVAQGGQAIRAEGFTLHPIPFARGRLSPVAALRTVWALRAVHRQVEPAICHHVALQVCVLASLAALGRGVAKINALTGFGYALTGARASRVRQMLGMIFRWLFVGGRSVILVQNPDDHDNLRTMGIPEAAITIIPGSGVDTDELTPQPEPAGEITIGYLGRLLADKGVPALVEAQRLLHDRGQAVLLRLGGTPDPANPTSLKEHEIDRWRQQPGIDLAGHVSNVREFWARAHIAALPSLREGLPKSLLEAAACGRPMVATDVPGCREIVHDGETGLLVPVDNAAALADALEKLIVVPQLRSDYGAAARRLVEQRFASTIIAGQIIDLYRRLMENRGTATA